MKRPDLQECPVWAKNYIEQVDGEIMEVLEKQQTALPDLLKSFADKADYAYAAGKWTVKQVAGHLIDTERILCYRLTSFSRGETAALPGFQEDDYVLNAHFADRTLENLTEEFVLLRKANMYLFNSLNESDLNQTGVASERKISVRAILFVIAGHVEHHSRILKERYL